MSGTPSGDDVPRRQHQVSFPAEIIQKILVQAWISFERRIEYTERRKGDCWHLYYNVSLVSRQYRECILWVSMTYVYLATPPEVAYYSDLVQKYGSCSPGFPIYRNAVTAAPRHVYINLVILGCITGRGSLRLFDSREEDIPGSRVAEFLKMSPSLELDDWAAESLEGYTDRFCLDMFPAVTHLRIFASVLRAEIGTARASSYDPISWEIFPSVTHLDIQDDSIAAPTGDKLREVLQKLLRRFPHVSHCRISMQRSILPLVGVLPCLEVLELEAGPWHGGSSSSIRHLCIASAVRKGLFATTQGPGSSKKRIRVYTGKGEMDIWEPTLRACIEHGVMLERVPILDDLSTGARTARYRSVLMRLS